MVKFPSLCRCCVKKPRKNSSDESDGYAYGNPVAVGAAGESPRVVQFRASNRSTRPSERHSQPLPARDKTTQGSTRVSVPPRGPRALPQLPPDLYSSINKPKQSTSTVPVTDELGNPMYETIDADSESFADPLYSKVTDPTSARRERKYDYPMFNKKDTAADDAVYQSASQLYAAGSEDPYSSIGSEPARAPLAKNEEEDYDDDTSAYDPGYAKVKPEMKPGAARRISNLEREVDHIYSKIRRSGRETSVDDEVDRPGPSRRLPLEVAEVSNTVVPVAGSNDSKAFAANAMQFDSSVYEGQTSSITSREPSYRYITVREDAGIVRERLRAQGALDPPAREHYYSTIGNEYEMVRDSPPHPAVEAVHRPAQMRYQDTLGVLVDGNEVVPPPPTSPIPDRMPTTVPRTSVMSSSLHEKATTSHNQRSMHQDERSSSLANDRSGRQDHLAGRHDDRAGRQDERAGRQDWTTTVPSQRSESSANRDGSSHSNSTWTSSGAAASHASTLGQSRDGHLTSQGSTLLQREGQSTGHFTSIGQSRDGQTTGHSSTHGQREGHSTVHRDGQPTVGRDGTTPAPPPLPSSQPTHFGGNNSFRGVREDTDGRHDDVFETSDRHVQSSTAMPQQYFGMAVESNQGASTNAPSAKTHGSVHSNDHATDRVAIDHGPSHNRQYPVAPQRRNEVIVMGPPGSDAMYATIDKPLKQTNRSQSHDAIAKETMMTCRDDNFNKYEVIPPRAEHPASAYVPQNSVRQPRSSASSGEADSLEASRQRLENLAQQSSGERFEQDSIESSRTNLASRSADSRAEGLVSFVYGASDYKQSAPGPSSPKAQGPNKTSESGRTTAGSRNKDTTFELTEGGYSTVVDLPTNRMRSTSPRYPQETEAEKIARLGTVYTANDYVSSVGMGTERPWPMNSIGAFSGGPSLGGGGIALQRPDSRVGATGSTTVFMNQAEIRFSWDLSDSDPDSPHGGPAGSSGSRNAGGGGGDCSDATCFCHGSASVEAVREANMQVMKELFREDSSE